MRLQVRESAYADVQTSSETRNKGTTCAPYNNHITESKADTNLNQRGRRQGIKNLVVFLLAAFFIDF